MKRGDDNCRRSGRWCRKSASSIVADAEKAGSTDGASIAGEKRSRRGPRIATRGKRIEDDLSEGMSPSNPRDAAGRG